MADSCPACRAEVVVAGRSVYGYSRLARCPDCGSEFLSPQPDDARLAAIYGPSYYEPWKWEEARVVRAMKARTFLRALGLLHPVAGARLLDVGCAQGELAEAALSVGMKVTGLDLNAAAIDVARKRVPAADFVCGELDPVIVTGDWDIVTMFDFIEHVRAPIITLSAAAGILAPKGRLLISTPCAGSAVHRMTGHLWPQYREEHLVLFSLHGMRAALDSAGMKILKVVPTTKYVTFAYLLGQAATFGPGPIRSLAQRSRGLLSVRPAHGPMPFRFGEMTVVAARKA
jgi:2-polyprenyl-3-methyl-5-hydroxy-6-metoxy-1,4-benzoquinol methylase